MFCKMQLCLYQKQAEDKAVVEIGQLQQEPVVQVNLPKKIHEHFAWHNWQIIINGTNITEQNISSWLR